MPSPFPGMDPYLESPPVWPGMHLSLIYTIRAEIASRLPLGYFAEVEQYVWLEVEEDPEGRRVKPDVYLREDEPVRPRPRGGRGAVAAPTARVVLPYPAKRRGKRRISITDLNGSVVVTVIEVLSPSDKGTDKDRTNYLLKREEYIASGVNLVEVDLLRAGHRAPMGTGHIPDGDYYLFISRGDAFPAADLWAFTVRDQIPVIPVPLKTGDDPVTLSIRAALDRGYDDAHYERKIDYTKPPVPALRGPDAEWAADLLKKPAKKRRR